MPALWQLEDIQDYVAEDNPRAAFVLSERIRVQVNVQLLEKFRSNEKCKATLNDWKNYSNSIDLRIFQNKTTLEKPFFGRPGEVHGTRELAISGLNYVVAYRVRDEAAEFLAVGHGAQDWPKTFE